MKNITIVRKVIVTVLLAIFFHVSLLPLSPPPPPPRALKIGIPSVDVHAAHAMSVLSIRT